MTDTAWRAYLGGRVVSSACARGLCCQSLRPVPGAAPGAVAVAGGGFTDAGAEFAPLVAAGVTIATVLLAVAVATAAAAAAQRTV